MNARYVCDHGALVERVETQPGQGVFRCTAGYEHGVWMDGGTLDLGLVRAEAAADENSYEMFHEAFAGLIAYDPKEQHP